MTAKKHAPRKHAKDQHKITAQEQFIIDLYPSARQVSTQTGMSWELILAQAAQETGWGKKVLAGTNNIFNVKALGDWKGLSKTFKVWEVVDGKKVWQDQPFRVYGSYQEALNDRVAFLRDNPRYRAAGLFDDKTKGDLRKEAAALQKGHYATDPHYADAMVKVFDGRTMQRALKEAQAKEAAASAATAPAPQPSPHP